MEHPQFDNPEFVKSYATVEGVTGAFGEHLLRQAGLDKITDEDDLVMLDQACGTSVVALKLQNMLSDKSKAKLDLTCADIADAMVEWSKRRIESEGWKGVKAIKCDAADTKLPSSHFTHYTFNFGPFALSKWQNGLSEMHRTLRPGGVAGFTAWKDQGWATDLLEALATDPELPKLPDRRPESVIVNAFAPDVHWDEPEWVKQSLLDAGFTDIEVNAVPHHTSTAETGGMAKMTSGVAQMYLKTVWSKEDSEKYVDRAIKLLNDHIAKKYESKNLEWDWVALVCTAKKPE